MRATTMSEVRVGDKISLVRTNGKLVNVGTVTFYDRRNHMHIIVETDKKNVSTILGCDFMKVVIA